MTNIFYTVIIPHYSKTDTRLLERAVNSIPNYPNIQVLVVDNSPIAIDANLFENRENVHILFSDKTKGAGHARNIGIDNAKGKWMLFLDADDFFVEGAFDVFKKHYDSSVDIVFFKMTSVLSDTMETADRHKSYEKMLDNYFSNKDEYPLRCSFPQPWSKLVRTQLVKNNNILFDEVPASNDVMFGLKIGLVAESIYVDNEVVYCVTVQKGSLTNTISLENIESRFNVTIRKNELLVKSGYKRSGSVMLFILSSMKFGIKPFFRLFYKALVTQNLFVGYDRWFKTFLSKKHLQNQEYKIEE